MVRVSCHCPSASNFPWETFHMECVCVCVFACLCVPLSLWVCDVWMMKVSGLPPGNRSHSAKVERFREKYLFFSSLNSESTWLCISYEIIFLSVSVSGLRLSHSSRCKSAPPLLIRRRITPLSHCARHFSPTFFNSVSSRAASRLISRVSRARDGSTFSLLFLAFR